MNENIAYVIVEKDTGRFINAERVTLESNITFKCFFPSESTAEKFRQSTLSDSRGRYFKIQEVEIVEFLNNQLTVAYETDGIVAPF